jgi:hypothetical protein
LSGLLDERDYEEEELQLGGEAVPGPGSFFTYPAARSDREPGTRQPARSATFSARSESAGQVSYPSYYVR